MSDPKPKLVQVNGIGVVSFPGAMDDSKIAAAIKSHKELSIRPSHEGKDAILPPELERVEHEVGAEYVKGKPYGNAIATVGEHEPHKIEINDPKRFAQGPAQTRAHELTHLWEAQLPGKLESSIPPDNPKDPYDLSNIDQLRKQGHTLATIPREQAATIVQMYTADPSQRARLQPWIQDLNTTPLSVMNPTDPNQKGINTTVRPPVPPIEGYLPSIKAQAKKLNPKAGQGLPPQPKEALNQYPNPEDRPAKESFAFNKAWAKPGPYLTTLSPDMEAKFQNWMKQNPGVVNLKSLNDPQSDYDTRGWWLAGERGDPAGQRVRNKWDGKMHGNDKFKTPYDGGFSRESMYALPNAPRWVGDRLMTADGRLVTDETPRKTGGAK